jgi:quercetin dioxygenase-like cupin family protein
MTSGAPAVQPFAITRDEAPKYWLVDSLWSVLATAETTGGELTVLDQVMPKRSGPPPHVHERLHEYFYILDGVIRFQIGTEVKTASAGSLVSVPRNTVHGFAVASDTARVLNLYTPAGFTEQITFMGTLATELRLPRDGEQVPPSEERGRAYATRSAELNTQRWLTADEASGTEDLLADERDTFRP